MSGLICVAGGKGAPGASTVALALALASGPERSVTLVDGDPDGGALAARLGVAATPGLVSLSAAARHGFRPELIGLHTQHIRPGVEFIAGNPRVLEGQHPRSDEEVAKRCAPVLPELCAPDSDNCYVSHLCITIFPLCLAYSA